jgi:putative inorganic carbon (hco3(-)) transporter
MPSFYQLSRPTEGDVTPPSKSPVLLILCLLVLIPGLITYTMANSNEWRETAIVLAIIAGGIIIARPFWGLLIFIALLYTRPEESINELAGLRIPLIVSVVTLVAAIFQKLLAREVFAKTPLNGMIIGFGASAVFSAMSSGLASVAAQDVGRLVIIVLLMVNLVNTPKRYQQVSTTILAFTLYLSAYSIYLYFTGGALNEHGLLRSQATGIFSDPNDIAGTIVAGLGLTLFRARMEQKFLRWVYIFISVVFFWAILLTNSRGGLVALMLLAIIFVFLTVRNKLKALSILLVAVVPLMLLSSSRMRNFDSGDESANQRFWYWTNGIDQLIQNPLLGVGYQSFTEVNGGMTAHNSFVLCFAETGLIGYFFWMGCFYYTFRTSRKSEPGSDSDASKKQALELLGTRVALIGFLASAFWISRTYVPILYLLISLPITQQLANPQDKKNEPVPTPLREWGRITLICLGSILAIYIYALRNR